MPYTYKNIDRVRVKNFRNLDDVLIDFSDSPIVALVGDNEAGKTSVIKAIAACSRSMERGKSLGLEKIYTSLEDMLKDDDIDAVYIAVPNLLHHSRAKQVLSAGKHCLLEKPFCVSEKEVDDLIALGKEKNLILMETIPPAYGQNIMFIQKVLDRLGRIRLVMSNFSQYSSRYDKLKNGEKPYIFVKHIYASASVVGSIVCVYMYRAFGVVVSMIISSAVILIIRYLAAKYHWNLPHIDFEEK